MAIVGYHLEKTMHLLRWSTNRSIFWLLHKSGNADEPGRVPSIGTSGSRKEQRLESKERGVKPPILAFPSMSWPILRHVAEHFMLEDNSVVFLLVLQPFLFQSSAQAHQFRVQFPCFWIIPMALRPFELICWVTLNASANSSCVWHESSTSNASNSKSSNFFFYLCHAGPRHQNHPSWSIKTTHDTFFY